MLDSGPETHAPAASPAAPSRPAIGLGSLPSYSRSLLKVKLPVLVTLAGKKQTLRRILELAPGSIIQFDKSCEDMLELVVGQQAVALGEAVKVGDKFGLRVTSMVLPDERFLPVQGART
jgi:flagellar motor switch/type III secretory pathway protein FliN